jgi:uroporphyrinogen decarboxylase
MDHRERVLTALNHRIPDRIPIDFGGTHDTGIVVGAYERLKKYLGIRGETILAAELDQLARIDEEILKRFDIDIRRLIPKTPEKWKGESLPDGSIRDMWGVMWRRAEDGHYYPYESPLKGNSNPSDLDHYQWPDPDEWTHLEELEKEAGFSTKKRIMPLSCIYPGGLCPWAVISGDSRIGSWIFWETRHLQRR